MDGNIKERWCMLRCTGGTQDSNVLINQTMLRFRPIAPKPVTTNGTVSGNLPVDNKNLLLTGKRSKRKYVRVRKNNGYKRKNRISSHDHHHHLHQESEDKDKDHDDLINEKAVTLQLLPERTDQTAREESTGLKNLDLLKVATSAVLEPGPTSFNFIGSGFGGPDRTEVVESWVTVESVTDTCMDTRGIILGRSTDVEIMNSLDKDTCPGFISDGSNRVQWVNLAYKKMVVGVGESETEWPSPEIMVRLVMKETLPAAGVLFPSFTARVWLQYTWQKEKCSKMVPCDVWKMDFGGFAWRLDIEAALGLGR
ncbi:hypothetical protein LWI28_001746 [Acer negundo]|uniref:DUF7950 domain-containing protein n=1 Tax=Acer negundo TaxID=4023 RepID=A0AAD5JI44_ACENE|nr:hypothetical protein LWI28_001746 [Acer negundo]KAK4857380.1 hypothetical protein QYF36_027365 [Acer negundo]